MSEISDAVSILQRGGLVAFPTETVYGLGADATNSQAIARIFAAKGRPSTNPLIVHVADAAVARRYAGEWPAAAEKLARRFWPGPLTLVVPKASVIVSAVTAGRNTVGLRAPDHPIALKLLREFDGPLAGPSANRSNRVSPTIAAHVQSELGNRVELILDGGPCRVGIESTVLDLSGATPTILRPGGISREMIESEIGSVELFHGTTDINISATSPGQHEVHYSPLARAIRFERSSREKVERWCAENSHERVTLLIIGSMTRDLDIQSAVTSHDIIEMPQSPIAYASRLYAELHAADERKSSIVWVEMPPDRPEWAAIRDRLMRATQTGE